MLKPLALASVAVVGGAAMALLTGLLPTTPPGLVGAVWYGFPFAWLYRLVVASQYYPWRADFGNLLLDAVFWVAIVLVILLVANSNRRSRLRQ